ncbi:MAG: beta-lactamase family protein [Candidatus Aminicenantes bacterium]|nr:beta-lactamase family protein [Candidatus Aminicenantes bacterium]
MTLLKDISSTQRRLCIFGFFAIFFLLFSGCDASKTLTKERKKTTENGLLKSIVFEGEKPERMKLSERMAYYKVPGVSISVIDNFKIEWTKGYGFTQINSQNPVTFKTIFQASSISQAVTASGVLALLAQKKMGLDVNINDYLQSWTIPDNQFTQKDKVTIRRLLSRSSGLVPLEYEGAESIENKASLKQILNGEKTENPPAYVANIPGTELEYSEAGYAMLEILIEDLSGQSFSNFMTGVILTPLKMERSSFAAILPEHLNSDAAFGHNREGFPIKGKGRIYPVAAANGLWTTPSDLAIFTIELMSAALGRSQNVFDPELARGMLSVHIGNQGLGLFIDDEGDNLHFFIRGKNEGFSCFLVGYPVKGQGVIIMTNSENGEYLIDEILRAVSEAYDWPHFLPEIKKYFRLDASVYQLYEGLYEVNPEYQLSVSFEDYYLIIQPSGQKATRFFVENATTFFSTDPYIRIRFVLDTGGKVTGLVLKQRDFSLDAKKIE